MERTRTHNFLGLDIGSTTVKIVVLDERGKIIFHRYQRHFSDIKIAVKDILAQAQEALGNLEVKMAITGSGGLGMSNRMGLPFVQEVIACTKAVEFFIPQTDVVIELGGEDAKITYLGQELEQRMNGACAGGTGAFIDQMALLLQTDGLGLDRLAENHKVLYPIASRCGVFAKTDIQPLLNQGAAKEDIAASIFQAVVNQTISGLACGKPIRGKVAFLGGPLNFLPQLRQRFIETLHLSEEEIIWPENAQYYAAWGAAYTERENKENPPRLLGEIINALSTLSREETDGVGALRPLFKDGEELARFKERHQKAVAKKNDIATYKGQAFLGIDAGSTTSKAVLIDDNGAILYSYYDSNRGEPIDLCVKILKNLDEKLTPDITIANTVVTGYGEELVKAAINADIGEVETMAHYKAANHFLPGVEFILDIGGQDMKAIRIRDGVIENIILNEACSSGCGSFIDTFARSLSISIGAFAEAAISSKRPMDLGNRCTVFMNSKVKQAQKEGVAVEDISAGLSYAVIKNALYKVIKIRRPEEFGKKILAQGGTFYNEAVLRAFELETGREVVRPDIAGLMGAYGAALIGKERWEEGKKSTLIDRQSLERFHYEKSFRHCEKCNNHCLLTVIQFPDQRHYISGNRCDIGAGLAKEKNSLPNLYDYKYKRAFQFPSLKPEEALRGTVGIPRVLNLYENYPFWHRFFTELGFSVVLSPRSDKKIFEKGMDSIPSEAVCYPAKLAHGHIMALVEKGLHFIFYPSVVYENQQFAGCDNHFNCPVVSGYPEVIKNNTDELRLRRILYKHPFVTLEDLDKTADTLTVSLREFKISKKEIRNALEQAKKEMALFREDMQKKGEETLDYIEKNHIKGIVLCGRPYHVDPEVNHGLTNLITKEGMAVLTEDSVSHLAAAARPLRVRDQWAYHSRLYNAAAFVAQKQNLELIQLTSFGCGLDAVTSDQVVEILQRNNKIYTSIKIDEGDNLGAARIRIRSLRVTMEERLKNTNPPAFKEQEADCPALFTAEMKIKHTIIAPQMSPIHFDLLETAMKTAGYRLVILSAVDKSAVEEGLKYVHNDACYPCILTTGQLMQALKSGEYDVDNVSVLMSQTGGQCRATNYISFIRKALKDAGMAQIPVISLSAQGLERHPGFKIDYPLIKRCIMALNYGDLLMKVLYRTRPYEIEAGAANALYQKWSNHCKETITSLDFRRFRADVKNMIHEFDTLPLYDTEKPRVGLVGEILVKFLPDANNHVVDLVEKEGGEAVMPGLTDFLNYCAYNGIYKARHLKEGKAWKSRFIITYLRFSQRTITKYLKRSRRFEPAVPIDKVAKMAEKIVSIGNQAGEGWLLTGEMAELHHQDINNIICMQPFACLPNHITGRGTLREFRRQFPQSNIMAIDYDPGASESNQLNRIKLMMSVAFKAMEKEQENDVTLPTSTHRTGDTKNKLTETPKNNDPVLKPWI